MAADISVWVVVHTSVRWCGRRARVCDGEADERESVTVRCDEGGTMRPDWIVLVEQVAAPRLPTGLQFPTVVKL